MSISARAFETAPDGLRFDHALTTVQANITDAESLATNQPILACGALLQALEKTAGLLAESGNIQGWFTGKKKKMLLEKATKLTPVIQRLQRALERTLKDESGIDKVKIQQANEGFVNGIRSTDAPALQKVITVGFVGDRIKGEYFPEDLKAFRQGRPPTDVVALHQTLDRAWQQARSISDAFPDANLGSLSNRLLLLRDDVAAYLPERARYEQPNA